MDLRRMFLLLMARIVQAVNDGYHSFKVTHKKPFCVALTTKMLVFALDETPDPSVNFSVIDQKNRSSPIPISTLTHLQLFETTILVTAPRSHPYVLHYWLLPRTVCSSISYAAIADRSISFELTSPLLKSEFCIFPQSGASSYSWNIDYHTTAPYAQIEFYTSAKKPSQICESTPCSFSSSRPAFVRVLGVADHEFNAAVGFTTFRNSITLYECSIKGMPLLIEPPVQIPMDLLSINEIKCMSMAESVLIWLLIGFCAMLVVNCIIYVLQRCGVISIKYLCSWGRESDHFTNLRQNPYASELDPD
jgi:hypothetical protein